MSRRSRLAPVVGPPGLSCSSADRADHTAAPIAGLTTAMRRRRHANLVAGRRQAAAEIAADGARPHDGNLHAGLLRAMIAK